MDNQREKAWERGVKLARFWKMLRSWDRRCVNWVMQRNLPKWMGHIPVFVAVSASLIGIILCGMYLATTIIMLWLVVYSFTHGKGFDYSQEDSYTNYDHTEFEAGPQGFGEYDRSGFRVDGYSDDEDY